MFCVGEACTSLNRETGLALPLVTGVGLNLRTGEMFPAMFSDKGPDMDLRLARTLTGGEKVSITNNISICVFDSGLTDNIYSSL